MSKELEVIKSDLDYERCVKIVKKEPNCCLAPRVNAIDIIAKKDKAFELIKNKAVNVGYILISENVEEYNKLVNGSIAKRDRQLTQQEYDLLKEMLL